MTKKAPLKRSCEMFFDKEDKCWTRIWYVVGKEQKMKVIETDPITEAEYRKHLVRTKYLWDKNEEPPKAPHGGSNINNRTEESAFSSKRGW